MRDVTDAAIRLRRRDRAVPSRSTGVNQFEISLAPQSPVAAADQLVLMRIIVGRAARRHGLRVSLSPVPFAGSVGSGAHQHFSLKRGDAPLFSGRRRRQGHDTGRGVARSRVWWPASPTPRACCADRSCRDCGCSRATGRAPTCAGEPKTAKPQCDSWSAGPATRRAPTSRSRSIDPSANPYFATAAILGLALDGIERRFRCRPRRPSTRRRSPRNSASTQASRCCRRAKARHSTRWRIRPAARHPRRPGRRRGPRRAPLRAGELRRSRRRGARREVPDGLESVTGVVRPDRRRRTPTTCRRRPSLR